MSNLIPFLKGHLGLVFLAFAGLCLGILGIFINESKSNINNSTNLSSPPSETKINPVTSINAGIASKSELSFERISFQQLTKYKLDTKISYPPDLPRIVKKLNKQIPSDIKQLNGRNITIVGYMSPLKVKNERTTNFLLYNSKTSCCYGKFPETHEIINVTVKGDGCDYYPPYKAVEVSGTLAVGAKVLKGTTMVSIYRLDAVDVRPQESFLRRIFGLK